MPSRTATPPVSATGNPTPTQNLAATASPTPPFGNHPDGDVAHYRLKPWDAADMWALIDADEPVFPYNYAEQFASFGYWDKVKQTLLREIKARAPGSPDASKADQRLADPRTYRSITSHIKNTIEPFRAIFETAINADPNIEFTSEALTQLAIRTLDNPNVRIRDVFPAKNILGDGQPGWIFEGNVDSNYTAGFALSGSPGKYRLVSPLQNWHTSYWGDQSVEIYDLNTNGIPEIGIQDSYWGAGMMHYCGEFLNIYEWQDDHFVNLTPNLSTNANTDAGGCSPFEFNEGPDGNLSITTGGSFATNCSSSNPSPSGDDFGPLKVTRRYEWNGRFFALEHTEIETMESTFQDDPLHPCRLAWIDDAGASSDQAFQTLPILLGDTDPNNIANYIENFGPAYLDFFRFKLGTWHAMRGQEVPALALLTTVRDRPANQDFDTASKLAAAFLEAYPTASAYEGCRLANDVINIYDDDYLDYSSLDVEAMGKAWGFFDKQWAFYGGFPVIFNRPISGQDVTNICNLADAFVVSIQEQVFTTNRDLISWLESQGIPYTGLVEGDVDGDGQPDWIVALGTGREQNLQLWVLLNKNGSIQPLPLEDLSIPPANLPVAWNAFTPDRSAPRLNVYQMPDQLLVFRLVSNNTWTGIETIHNETPSDQSYQSFTIRAASGEATKPKEQDALELYLEKDRPGLFTGKDWDVYAWDHSVNSLRRVSYLEYEQEQKVQNVEKLLFDDGNPRAALQALDPLINNRTMLLDMEPDANVSMPAVHPYLLYLRAVAYEMSGNDQEALADYWTVWHDFPLYPFSYVIQQRLEKK